RRGDGGDDEKPLPLDLSHLFSVITKGRQASKMKEAYRLFQIPGIMNIAGGLPNVQFFPFDTLEAQTAEPERWTPSPNYPGESGAVPASACAASTAAPTTTPVAAAHIVVPKAGSHDKDVVKRIDLETALQYGQAEGYPPLVSWVRQFTREQVHPDVPYRGGPEVAMTCGSTDGFAKTLQVFADPWRAGVDDPRDRPGLLCEKFAYMGALGQAANLGWQLVPVDTDAKGMRVAGPGGLDDVLSSWDPARGRRPHLLYTVTLGHNPTGIVIPLDRKREIYAACSKYDVIIAEDEPYWYLQFPAAAVEEAASRGGSSSNQTSADAPPQQQPPTTAGPSSGYPFLDSLAPSFLRIDTDGRVVRLDTFSKTVAPGCRLGWVTAQPAVIDKIIRVSEATTQQPSGFVQSLVAELVMGPQPEAAKAAFRALGRGEQARFAGWHMDGWVRWLEGLRGSYERRMVRMCRLLDAGADLVDMFSSPLDSFEWGVVTKTRLFDYQWPRGGMFIWLRVHFERHPLWQAPVIVSSLSSDDDNGGHHHIMDGPTLSLALMLFLTAKKYLVLCASGSMFGATAAVPAAWAYYRLCFAAETEANIDLSAQRFTAGVQDFFRLADVADIEKILE
ncbi:pyridoxal phosphate-dependent transferase, partial [Lasiosphaeria miniovina]